MNNSNDRDIKQKFKAAGATIPADNLNTDIDVELFNHGLGGEIKVDAVELALYKLRPRIGNEYPRERVKAVEATAHTIKQLIQKSNTEAAIKELERVMEIPGSAFVGNGQSEIHWQTHNRIEQLKSKLEKGIL